MNRQGYAQPFRSRKGKERAVEPMYARDGSQEGKGDEDGVVLPLTMLQTTSYETAYTLPIKVGSSEQVIYLEVDSGSSDLWVASNSCGTQPCKQVGSSLYDPSHSTATNQTFEIDYVEGKVTGPIVWDRVSVGGYIIDAQALAAASEVDNEPLSSEFSGVLGLALPANSVIASVVPPVVGNQADGAVFASNLFTMTPSSTAPSARFFSLTLARPEANGGGIQSQLGIGKHPADVVTNASRIQYDTLSSYTDSGPHHWQARVNGISVWVDGVEKVVNIGQSAMFPGTAPTAVVDSGTPVILTSTAVANAIYGAIGVGPSGDGQYYLPCTTPLNMSIVLDSRRSIPLHPLDLSLGTGGSGSNDCMGMVQIYPPGSSVYEIADLILGVPFMRSTYMVMAYDPPDDDGIFPNATALGPSIIRPRLGLLGLTNATVALDEFHTVRVLNQPLAGAQGSGSGTSNGRIAEPSGKKLSVGLEVLIGLVGFFALCFGLFAVRWAVHRRKLVRMRAQAHGRSGSWGTEESKEEAEAGYIDAQAALRLARRSTLNSRYGPSEDTLMGSRASKYDELKRLESSSTVRRSEYLDDTARTRVGEDGSYLKDVESGGELRDAELGFRPGQTRRASHASSVPASPLDAKDGDMGMWAMGQGTLVDGGAPRMSLYTPEDEPQDHDVSYFNLPREYPPSPNHARGGSAETAHVGAPLLGGSGSDDESPGSTRPPMPGHGRTSSRGRIASYASASGSDTHSRRLSSTDFALADFEPGMFDVNNPRGSMAGVGRARISSFGEPFVRPPYHGRTSSASPLLVSSPLHEEVVPAVPTEGEHLGEAL